MKVATARSRQIEREDSRRPSARRIHVAARFLDRVAPLGPGRLPLGVLGACAIDHELERRQRRKFQLVAVRGSLKRSTLDQRRAHGIVVGTVVDRDREVEAHSGHRALELVEHVHGVLAVRHQQPFLDDDAAHVITPDRQTGLEPEFCQGHELGVVDCARREVAGAHAVDVAAPRARRSAAAAARAAEAMPR